MTPTRHYSIPYSRSAGRLRSFFAFFSFLFFLFFSLPFLSLPPLSSHFFSSCHSRRQCGPRHKQRAVIAAGITTSYLQRERDSALVPDDDQDSSAGEKAASSHPTHTFKRRPSTGCARRAWRGRVNREHLPSQSVRAPARWCLARLVRESVQLRLSGPSSLSHIVSGWAARNADSHRCLSS